jgi:hypothetical protein
MSPSEPRAYTTYFDERYLALAVVMLRSIRRWDPGAAIFALCFDRASHGAITALRDSAVVPVSGEEMLEHEPRLAGCAARPRAAFYATHKPILPLLAFARRPDLAAVVHVDADCCFFSSPAALFEEIAGASVALSPHDFSPVFEPLLSCGRFNAGLIYWRRDPVGLRCLADYRDDCLAWCEPRVEADGRFMNQGYLTGWPERYPGVHVIGHSGVNVAYWNIANRRVIGRSRVTVNGKPLVCYHFSGLFLDEIGVWRSARREFGPNLKLVIQRIYRPYLKEVCRADRKLRRRDPHLARIDTGWEKAGAPVGRGPWPSSREAWLARARWTWHQGPTAFW